MRSVTNVATEGFRVGHWYVKLKSVNNKLIKKKKTVQSALYKLPFR